MSRITLFRLISVLLGLVLPLLALEAVLQVLPTTSVALRLPVNAADPVARFPAHMAWQASFGWRLKDATHGHTNNAGFVSDFDYHADAKSPLMAIVGDSFVEAMSVSFDQSLQGRLQSMIGDRGRIYGFGMSGAPLSQYLVWAEHAAKRYKPATLCLLIIANDFDESVLKYKLAKGGRLYGGFHYYDDVVDSTAALKLKLVPYSPSPVLPLLNASALARYSIFHLRAHKLRPRDVISFFAGSAAHASPAISQRESALHAIFEPAFFEAWPERLGPSKRAVKAFLRDLPKRTGLPAAHILLVMDGLRTALLVPELSAQAKASFFGRMRHFLMSQARQAGFGVLDLQRPFQTHYAKTGQRLEFTHDYHWNATGYAVAARAVSRTSLFRKTFNLPATARR